MDKDFANRLLDALESVYTENVALKRIMCAFRKDLPPQYQLDRLLARTKGDPLVATRVHKQFQPLRACISENANGERALRQVLQAIPLDKDITL